MTAPINAAANAMSLMGRSSGSTMATFREWSIWGAARLETNQKCSLPAEIGLRLGKSAASTYNFLGRKPPQHVLARASRLCGLVAASAAERIDAKHQVVLLLARCRQSTARLKF
jgi:hypothetical protein